MKKAERKLVKQITNIMIEVINSRHHCITEIDQLIEKGKNILDQSNVENRALVEKQRKIFSEVATSITAERMGISINLDKADTATLLLAKRQIKYLLKAKKANK